MQLQLNLYPQEFAPSRSRSLVTDLQSCKVNHAVNVWVRRKDFVERRPISDIYFVELRSFATQKLYAIQRHFRRIVQIVDNDDLVAMFEQSESGEGANVARTTA